MTVRIITADVFDGLAQLEDESVDCVVTSPPYWGLRDYGAEGQIGLEPTLGEHLEVMVRVFGEVRRVLKPTGTLWLNYGDAYAGSWGAQGHRETAATMHRNSIRNHPKTTSLTGKIIDAGLKPKDLYMIANRLAIALQDDGWWVRSEIIWHKPNPMPESVTDRPTSSHEKIWLLSKSQRYFYDAEAVKEAAITGDPRMPTAAYAGKNDFREGPRKVRKSVKRGGFNGKSNQLEGREAFRAIVDERNLRNVWTIPTKPFSQAHFATFPPDLVEPCIKAGCPDDGLVLDPFGGSGTVGMVADRLGRDAVLIELNPEYAAMARTRIERDAGMFGEVT